MKIKYVEGDLFKFVPEKCNPNKTACICHVVNDLGRWGSGFVLPLADHFPKAEKEYLKWARGEQVEWNTPFKLGAVQHVDVSENVIVYNMVGQHGVGHPRPLRYNALSSCMDKVARLIENDDRLIEIHAPLFGSDLAGGDWNFIEQLIIDCWLRNNIPVTIYRLPRK
ncbi:MAG: Appr-1-p processing protein [Candidatus Cloacimonetes bacterium]|jgi:hypothetical protein|nr:Appr-1-p processing protein [Candidatus Cloacimonadota bacterium]